MKDKVITLFEHEKVDLKERGITLKEREVRALESFNTKFRKKQNADALNLEYRGGKLRSIKARNYVGVIKVETQSFQIIPKLSREESSSDYSKQAIRNLLFMLSYTKKIKIKEAELAGLNRVKDDFFETLIYLYSKNLLDLIQNNVYKNYVDLEGNLIFLKGKIDMPRHIKNNSVSKNRFYVKYEEFCEDNLLNQIFKYTTHLLLKTTKSNYNYKKLQEISFLFDEVSFKKISSRDFERVTLNRLNSSYEPVLNLAKIFVMGSSLEMSPSNINTFSFLFDMNILFEEFIGEITKKIFFGGDHKVSTQGPFKYLVQEMNGHKVNKFRMIPDIQILNRRDGVLDLIVDTKYKILDFNDNNYGIKQSDLYQMFAYSKKFNCEYIILLYPRLEEQNIEESNFKLDEYTHVYKRTVNLCRDLTAKEQREELKQELKDIFYINTPIDENVN